MKVKELIKELKLYPDQDVDVFAYDSKYRYPIPIHSVDLSISDRCDINLDSENI